MWKRNMTSFTVSRTSGRAPGALALRFLGVKGGVGANSSCRSWRGTVPHLLHGMTMYDMFHTCDTQEQPVFLLRKVVPSDRKYEITPALERWIPPLAGVLTLLVPTSVALWNWKSWSREILKQNKKLLREVLDGREKQTRIAFLQEISWTYLLQMMYPRIRLW